MPGRSLVSGTSVREKFTGKERDAETGLDYFGARYYMSALGRWTSVDPRSDDLPGYSSYVYVLNNPIKLIDPDGEFPGIGTIIGSVVGAATGAYIGYKTSGGDWKATIAGAAGGATTGLIGGAFADAVILSGGVALVAGAGVGAGASAAGNVVEQVVGHMLNGEDLSQAVGKVELSRVGNNAIVGAGGGVVATAVGQVVGAVARSAGVDKVLQGNITSQSKAVLQNGGDDIAGQNVASQAIQSQNANGLTTLNRNIKASENTAGAVTGASVSVGQSANVALDKGREIER